MKKYDLYIVGAYLIVFGAIFIYILTLSADVERTQADVNTLFEMRVDSVVINSWEHNLVIIKEGNPEYNRGDWQLSGHSDAKILKLLTIDNGVLYLENINIPPIEMGNRRRIDTIYVSKDTPIQLNNSPNTVIMVR